MTKIRPFKAIRPSRDKVYLVPTRPYYAYKKNVLEAKLDSNPYTFLHVINPEFHKDDKTKPNSIERYQKSKEKLKEFIDEEIFIKEQRETLYLYRQSKDGRDFIGLIGGASVEEYKSGKIKKHEATITSREKHFSDYLSIVECNAEPVLLFHQEHKALSELLTKISKERPEYEFSSTQKIKHEVWLIQETEILNEIQQYYQEINNIYIADGHHRCASSARYSKEVNAINSDVRNHFLAYFISEKKMDILDYNRLISDLNNLTENEFLEKIKVNFTISETSYIDGYERSQHNILMYLSTKWYNLEVKTELIDNTNVVNSLDTAILTNQLLEPILGILDLKTDNRISFINGTKGLKGIEAEVKKGNAAVGFALFPVSVEQLKAVADNNKIMPPKSTWIEPKLRSGLTMYPLNND